MKKQVLLIDYENIQQIDLAAIEDLDITIKLFIGKSQNRIPFELVQQAQRFGAGIEWIKIDGNGNNALDFHIAYYLGYLTHGDPNSEYIVLSKDKGFDPVIRFINRKNISCRRINSIVEIVTSQKKPTIDEVFMKKVLDNLKKIEKSKRPRKRTTLQKHVYSLGKGSVSEKAADQVLDELFIEGLISEANERLTYEF